MTNGRVKTGPFPAERRDRLIEERRHDPYRPVEKLPDPTACPDCGALYREGRWTWEMAPDGAHSQRCPACQRDQDDYPAGILTLSGAFLAEHREEILGLARNVEEREKGEHALKRIMQIDEEPEDEEEGTIVIKTTDSGLARNIADVIHRSYEGELDYEYTDGDELLRVRWSR
jgi:hypothetical protein